MVKLVVICFLFFFISGSGFAETMNEIAPEVKVIVNKPQVEMGKYLTVRIEYTGDSVPELSNLQQWYEDFYVERQEQEAEKLANGLFQYTEYLRLYPRKVGSRVLGAIALGGAIAQPIKINVKPAVRNGIDGTPHWQPLPDSIWQGQTIEVSIQQNSLHPSNQITMEEGKFPGFYVEELDDKTIIQKHLTTVQLRWLLTAQGSGLMQLEAPVIEQRGRGRWRFYLPRTLIKVKPLPSYIPPTVPVGKLSIHADVIEIDNKPVWTVELQNTGQLPDEVHGIRKQLSELTGLPLEEVEVSVYRPDKHSPETHRHRYRIAVPNWTWGFTDGPKIRVQYFDVDKGRIKTVSDSLPGVWYITKVWRNILWFVFVLMFLLALILSTRIIKNMLAWRRYRQLLRQTKHAHELRRILLTPGDCATLDAWSATKHCHKAEQIARQLNAHCYARLCHISFDDIKQLVIDFHTYRRWLQRE